MQAWFCLVFLTATTVSYIKEVNSLPTATEVFPYGNSKDLFEGDIKLTKAQEKAVKRAIKNHSKCFTLFLVYQ